MKAARIHECSGPTAVRVDEVEVLEPGFGEVRIRVGAAGINNSDLQATYGTYQGYGNRGLPHILGQEAAGEVDAVGLGVQGLLELGAVHGIDYSVRNIVAEVLKITNNSGVQVALDGAGKVTFAHCLEAIASNGRIASYGTTTGMDAALPIGKLLGRNATIYGIALWYNSCYQASLRTLRDLVIPAFTQGKLQPIIDKVVDLEGVSEALIKMENRDLIGKIIIVP